MNSNCKSYYDKSKIEMSNTIAKTLVSKKEKKSEEEALFIKFISAN
jgi:hypothetical protein